MSANVWARLRVPSMDALPVVAVAALGCGVSVAIGGAASGQASLGIAGGLVAAAALGLLLAEDRLEPLAILVLSLPLPALYASADMRIPPALPVTALIVAGWALAWGPSGRRVDTSRLPLLAGTAVVAAWLLAGALSPHRAAAARELANLLLLGALLLVGTDLLARRPERAKLAALAIAAVAGVTGALAVLESAGVLPGRFQEADVTRAALGFGQPNGLGMFLALAVPFTVHVRRAAAAGLERRAATLALAANVAGLVATFSRGSWLSVLLGAGVLLLVGEKRFVLRVWAVALAAALVADVASGGAVSTTATGVFRDWSVAQRGALMLAGVRLFLAKPLLGAGPGGFAEELDRLGVLVPELWDLQPTPHNAYIQVAAETGVVGLAAFAWLLFALVRRARQTALSPAASSDAGLRRAALWALGIACAEGLVEWPLSHGHGQLVVLAAALACALPHGHDTPEAGGP